MMHILLSILLAPLTAHAADLIGTAKNAKGEILYIEKHKIQLDQNGLNKFIRVEYSKPGGEVFATMTSDFSKNRFVPETVFEDKRFATQIQLRIQDQNVEFEKRKEGKVLTQKKIPLKESMVASQGFDNFIRANAKTLEAQPLEFEFGVLEKKDFFSLKGVQKPNSANEKVEYGIDVSNWFVRLFTKELRVVYERNRLKSFVGVSNILADNGDSQDVSIHYDWAKN